MLPHPYLNEINDLDNKVTEARDLATSITPQRYKGLEDTPFLFVETED